MLECLNTESFAYLIQRDASRFFCQDLPSFVKVNFILKCF